MTNAPNGSEPYDPVLFQKHIEMLQDGALLYVKKHRNVQPIWDNKPFRLGIVVQPPVYEPSFKCWVAYMAFDGMEPENKFYVVVAGWDKAADSYSFTEGWSSIHLSPEKEFNDAQAIRTAKESNDYYSMLTEGAS